MNQHVSDDDDDDDAALLWPAVQHIPTKVSDSPIFFVCL